MNDGLLLKVQENHPQRHLVDRFNDALRKAARAVYSNKRRATLFWDLNVIKHADMTLLYDIPKAAWHRLWKIQSSFRPLDGKRLDYLKELVADMEFAGVHTSRERAIITLEILSEQGNHKLAIAKWEAKHQKQARQRGRRTWLDAGTRLYAAAGDIDRACQILHLTLKGHQNIDPRFVLFLIWRQVESGDSSQLQPAWVLYQRLKMHRSFRLSIDDCNSLFKCFLDAGQRRTALQILKDIAGAKKRPNQPNQAGVLMRGIRELQNSCTKLDDLHSVSLEALSWFPKDMDLAPFFLSWIRKSSSRFFGVGITETCARIIELIFESGHAPEPYHLDELIRVWFLTEQTDNAESIGWDMVNKRMAMSKQETPDSPSDTSAKPQLGANVPEFLRRPVPPAAASTFAHLAQHYAEAGQADYCHSVLNLLYSSSLYLNCKAVQAVLAIHLTLKEHQKAWLFFLRIREQDAAAINLHVYSTLWKGCILYMREMKRYEIIGEHKVRFVDKGQKRADGVIYPSARTVFAYMLDHIRNQYPAGKTGAQVPMVLYDRIIGSFMHAGDFLGAFVAMQTLKEVLDLTPTPETVKILIYYTARKARKAEAQVAIEEPMKYYTDMAHGVLEYFFVNANFHDGRKPRVDDLYEKGFAKTRGADLLQVLETYMMTLMARYWGSKETVESYLEYARRDMDVIEDSVDSEMEMGVTDEFADSELGFADAWSKPRDHGARSTKQRFRGGDGVKDTIDFFG